VWVRGIGVDLLPQSVVNVHVEDRAGRWAGTPLHTRYCGVWRNTWRFP